MTVGDLLSDELSTLSLKTPTENSEAVENLSTIKTRPNELILNSDTNSQNYSVPEDDLADTGVRNAEQVTIRKCSGARRLKKNMSIPSVVINEYSDRITSAPVTPTDFENCDILRSRAPDSPSRQDRKTKVAKCLSIVTTTDANHLQSALPVHLRCRRISDCSTGSSHLSESDDDVEVSLRHPLPGSSNWKKVRNAIQWIPFIQTYKRQQYPWVQLTGHQGHFKAGSKPGTILKKLSLTERRAFEDLKIDALQRYVPEYFGTVEVEAGEKYLQLQDLLTDFSSPCIMDVKMGVRTYLEEELAKARHNPKLRKDMYEKMIQIDPEAPTEAESRAKAVTKPRYMVWRDTISSTANLGLRIEGVRMADGDSSKDFKTTRTREQVADIFAGFVEGYSGVTEKYMQRLKQLRLMLEKSYFFKTHELIGSSLLFVHNSHQIGIWLIDFAKTTPLPHGVKISHNVPWVEGTHEDGYLIGLDNLIDIFGSQQQRLSEAEPVVQNDLAQN